MPSIDGQWRHPNLWLHQTTHPHELLHADHQMSSCMHIISDELLVHRVPALHLLPTADPNIRVYYVAWRESIGIIYCHIVIWLCCLARIAHEGSTLWPHIPHIYSAWHTCSHRPRKHSMNIWTCIAVISHFVMSPHKRGTNIVRLPLQMYT